MRSAIIDIGYNAIRAVVYEYDGLGAPEIFSDKLKSDIQNLLTLDNLETTHQSYFSLYYLVHIFQQLSVTNIECVATAALRGHPRAEEFKKIVKKKFNIDINILSGDREAYLTATGLISGIDDAAGVAADLGGGSLELAAFCGRKVGNLTSLPLGTKIIAKNNLSDLELIKELIKQKFGQSHYQNLYLIGGALRFIGRLYMEFASYPLKNLHNLEIKRQDFEAYLRMLSDTQVGRLNFLQRRIDYNAVLIVKALLEVFAPEKLVISNYGLKEGVRFSALTATEQAKNIIYERVKALVKLNGNVVSILSKYSQVIDQLLINADLVTLSVVELTTMLSQFNQNIDKTLRANFTVEFILASDIPFSHRQRLMLGLALACAYSSRSDMRINKLAKTMLSKTDYYHSQIIGNFIRISKKIDGPECCLPSFALKLKDHYIEITTAKTLPQQTFKKISERLQNIFYARQMLLVS